MKKEGEKRNMDLVALKALSKHISSARVVGCDHGHRGKGRGYKTWTIFPTWAERGASVWVCLGVRVPCREGLNGVQLELAAIIL